jgi:ligand-binding sensor domain-containing protein
MGVVEFLGGRKTRTLAEGYFARAVFADTRGVSIGTQDEGIVEAPFGRNVVTANSNEMGPVQRIVELEAVRYALDAGGLYRLEERAWRRVIGASAEALADGDVSALAIGSGGKLWVGYFDHGLDIVELGFEKVAHFEDDRLFCVNRIVTDGVKTAVATANGLLMFGEDGSLRQTLTRKEGLIADHVTDVLFRMDGMVAATPAGLSFIGDGGVRSLYVFHGLVNNHVYALAAEGQRTMAGTLGGVSALEGEVVRTNYTTANSNLRHNWITAMVRVDKEWFAGTYGAGVLRLDEQGRWSGFADLHGDLIVNPNALTVTQGRVYAGSLDRGLFVYDRASGRWTNTVAGLPSANVTALAVGGGYLYIGTDNGVVRMSEGAVR